MGSTYQTHCNKSSSPLTLYHPIMELCVRVEHMHINSLLPVCIGKQDMAIPQTLHSQYGHYIDVYMAHQLHRVCRVTCVGLV